MFTEKTILNCIFTWGVLATLVVFMGLSGASRATAQIGAPKGLNVLTKINVNAYGFEVRTVYPSKVQGQVSFSKVAWNCQGNICTTQVKYPGFGVSACHALAMKVGPIHSFRLTKQPPRVVPVKGYPLSATQISRCNQGVSAPKNIKINTSAPALNTRIDGTGTTVGEGAKRAKAIGEASDRMKQAKELQRLRDMGTPMGQAMGGGAAAGRQDCSRSSDRAKCLRDNLNVGKASAASGGGMRECIMGANPQNCFNRGKAKRPGTLNAGPGDPRDQVKDPRDISAVRVGSYDTGFVIWSRWETTQLPNGTVRRSRSGHDTDGNQFDESIFIYDDGYSAHVVRETSGSGGNLSKTVTHTEIRNEYDVVEEETESTTYRQRRNNGDTPPDSDNPGGSGQAAPDSASSGPADNCNWNPALGRCMKPAPDPRGNTSQPGPDGQNTGGILGRNTPQTDVGAAINCGDASSEACNRAGTGLSNRAKPLDHKDPGPIPGSAPH